MEGINFYQFDTRPWQRGFKLLLGGRELSASCNGYQESGWALWDRICNRDNNIEGER